MDPGTHMVPVVDRCLKNLPDRGSQGGVEGTRGDGDGEQRGFWEVAITSRGAQGQSQSKICIGRKEGDKNSLEISTFSSTLLIYSSGFPAPALILYPILKGLPIS